VLAEWMEAMTGDPAQYPSGRRQLPGMMRTDTQSKLDNQGFPILGRWERLLGCGTTTSPHTTHPEANLDAPLSLADKLRVTLQFDRRLRVQPGVGETWTRLSCGYALRCGSAAMNHGRQSEAHIMIATERRGRST
jgi:hypothetical protein